MKLALVLIGLAVCLATTNGNQVSIQDVKVVTPDGVFEEKRVQETENGKVVRSETIRINKPNEKEPEEDKAAEPSPVRPRHLDQDTRKALLYQFMKHYRLAKMLHGILSTPAVAPSSSSDQPEKHHHCHPHRVLIFRLPLASLTLPVGAPAPRPPTLPVNPFSLKPFDAPVNTTDAPVTEQEESQQTNLNSDSPPTEIPIQDQIPPPEPSVEQITDS